MSGVGGGGGATSSPPSSVPAKWLQAGNCSLRSKVKKDSTGEAQLPRARDLLGILHALIQALIQTFPYVFT